VKTFTNAQSPELQEVLGSRIGLQITADLAQKMQHQASTKYEEILKMATG
jgi:hypothetical protein